MIANSPQSSSQIDAIAAGLSKLKPGFLPLSIFLEITRLSVTPIIEVVPLRSNDKCTEVLLLERSADDPYWPNQFHTPGTVLRPTDQEHNYSDAFQRIFKDELKLNVTLNPVFVTTIFHRVARGSELALIFYLEITTESPKGTFYKSDSLPANIVSTQVGFIDKCIESYNRHNKGENL